jgi:Xaa-Pro dipeptidase
MREQDVAAVVFFAPANMLAFTGTPHASSDRLACGFLTGDGGLHVICPAFELPTVAGARNLVTIHTWEEHEDPYTVFAGVLRKAGVTRGTVRIDGRVWLDSWRRFESAVGESIKLESAEPLLREVRLCKSTAACDALRKACAVGEQVFLAMRRIIRAGATELELHQQLASEFCPNGRGGARPLPWIEPDPMVQSGPNGAVPHNPTGTRKLAEGDTVVMDSVVALDGYNSDITRTFAIGEPGDRAKQAYRAVRSAQQAAIEAARPGVECQELDRIARKIITDAGFGRFFTHRLGHGLGIEVHEPPYLVGGNREKLREGMCVTIEPGVYLPGEFGIRIEDDVLITADGCEVLRRELPVDVSDGFDR